MEDAVRTKSGFIRQLCGIIGFMATNAYLTVINFSNFDSPSKPEHLKFRMELATRLLTKVGADSPRLTRSIMNADNDYQLGALQNLRHVVNSL